LSQDVKAMIKPNMSTGRICVGRVREYYGSLDAVDDLGTQVEHHSEMIHITHKFPEACAPIGKLLG
jgi:hypothetical protein